jgi:tetratricopeptide (TPR) repeat protein
MAPDWPEGVLLSKAAFELADAGRLQEAADKYAEAVRVLDPGHYWSPSNHGEYASVLSRLGRNEDALREYEIALQQEEALYAGDTSAAPVVVARYFLAEHLLRMGAPEEALAAVAPILEGARQEPLSHSIKSAALHAMGRGSEAIAAAHDAVQLAHSDEQRKNVRERLAVVLQSPEPGAGEQGDEADEA